SAAKASRRRAATDSDRAASSSTTHRSSPSPQCRSPPHGPRSGSGCSQLLARGGGELQRRRCRAWSANGCSLELENARRIPSALCAGPTVCPLSSMPRAPVPPGTAGSGGCRGACPLLLVLLGMAAGGAHAELLGTHPHRNGTVYLMTDLCRDDRPSAGQRARQTVGGREHHGCWGVDRAGNPVVTWSDGSELELDADKVTLSRRIAGLLEERAASPSPRSPAPASAPSARLRAEV